MKHLQTSILGDSGISISGKIREYRSRVGIVEALIVIDLLILLFVDIDTIMQTLLDKKKLLEAEDQSIEMEVLLDFLNSTKRRKMEV